jgi:transcriptional regulator with XRE-family HTH domain
MEQQQSSIGSLMKAARKFKKYNQSEVAQAIGCSQSALSKMEHNLLVPNAPQWFLFSRFTAIPPETIESGIIDRHTRVKLNNEDVSLGYKLPKRYRLNRAQKVREVYPYLFYLEKNQPAEIFAQFMTNVGIDPEFFLDFDNLINFQLIVDLIHLYLRLGVSGADQIAGLVESGQNHLYWDRLTQDWDRLSGLKDLMLAFGQEQPQFQGDFKISVEEEDNKLRVSFIPEPHLYHFLKDVNDEVSDWLSLYRKFTLQGLIKRVLSDEREVKLIKELSRSPLESHFEIN